MSGKTRRFISFFILAATALALAAETARIENAAARVKESVMMSERAETQTAQDTKRPLIGAFSILYGKNAEAAETASALPPELETAIQDAVLEYQTLIRDPKETERDLPRAKANCWRALGEGSDGRLFVPFAGIDTAVCEISIYSDAESVQAVVDLPGTAADLLETGWADHVLADHRAQDFGGLLLVRPGTTGYLSHPDGSVLVLRCTGVENGINDGVLHRKNGAVLKNESSFLAYTCRQNARDIRLTYWDVAEILEGGAS